MCIQHESNYTYLQQRQQKKCTLDIEIRDVGILNIFLERTIWEPMLYNNSASLVDKTTPPTIAATNPTQINAHHDGIRGIPIIVIRKMNRKIRVACARTHSTHPVRRNGRVLYTCVLTHKPVAKRGK